MKNQNYAPIQDYAIIGNCRTTALVHKEGSVDFFCYPRFDSPSIFAKLLDEKKGGFFNTRPQFEWKRSTQSYLLESNVLLTRFFSEDTTMDIIDFMPCIGTMDVPNQLIRIVKSIRGTANVSFELVLAPEYGSGDGTWDKLSDTIITCSIGKDDDNSFNVESNISLFQGQTKLIDSFELHEGTYAIFVLGELVDVSKHADMKLSEIVLGNLDSTLKYWKDWLSKCNYTGEFQDDVRRSALVLKLLTSSEFGSTVAAATFSLPESIVRTKNHLSESPNIQAIPETGSSLPGRR